MTPGRTPRVSPKPKPQAAPSALPRPAPAALPAPTFFAHAALFRRWLAQHHARTAFLWVGFHKTHTGTPSLTWPESVREALCFGWIDGLRKSLGASGYVIRFSPRKPGSIWSAVNLRHVAELNALGRMQPAGLAAFAARSEARSRVYSYEKDQGASLSAARAAALAAEPLALAHFQARPPGYRATASHWVESAKQESTRARRFAELVAACREGRPIAPLRWAKK